MSPIIKNSDSPKSASNISAVPSFPNVSKNSQIFTVRTQKAALLSIKLPLHLCHTQSAKLLLDSGSEISILKLGHAKDDVLVYTDQKVLMKGVTENLIASLGVATGKIQINGVTFIHSFHLVRDDFPIPTEGILGQDFLSAYKAIINQRNSKFSFVVKGVEVCLPITELQNSIDSEITIPARCEYMAKVPVNFKETKLCLRREISPGLFIGNCIVQPQQGACIVNIVNSTENSLELKTSDIQFESLDDYQMINFTAASSNKRLDLLEEQIDTSHMNLEERESILHICREFNDLFHLEGDQLTHTDIVKHEIPLISDKPVFVKPYRLPESQKQEVYQQINNMLDEGIIQHSCSPYNSPILVVPKKPDREGNKKWRLVVDFRKLNEITESDAYPLPNITEILDQLGNSKYFSVVDLAHGFHQIPISEKSKPLTAFSFYGHYEYCRMPMGLKGAPATFQRLMNNVLVGLQGLKCFVYLDDIIIYGNSLQDHNSKLIDIFSRLRQSGLKLQPQKCEFLRKEITYLGHIISEDGVKPDVNKIKAVLDFPVPTNEKQLKSFLGLASYYRRFMKNFSQIAYPLNNLLKKNVTFDWNALCEEAFNKIKEKLTSPPILQFPDFSKNFILTTDASQYAIGSILSQGVPGNDLPVAYASRTLNKAEINYSTIERELLAIVWSVQHFRPYLFGRKFTIMTDHKPLVYLFSVSDPSSRLLRFRLKLEEYDYNIIYKPGKYNNADSLSRIHRISVRRNLYKNYLKEIENNSINNDLIVDSDKNLNDALKEENIVYLTDREFSNNVEFHNSVYELKAQDPQIHNIAYLKSDGRYFIYLITRDTKNHISSYEDLFYCLFNLKEFCFEKGISQLSISSKLFKAENFQINAVKVMLKYIFKNSNIVVTLYHENIRDNLTTSEIQEILKEFHVTSLGGHEGVNKTFNRIKQYYKWKNMFKDIQKYVRSCEQCQKNKCSRHTKLPMIITTTSKVPFEKIFLDIVGPLNQSDNNNKYVLTFHDDLTKFSIAIPLPNQEANTIAHAFATRIVCQYGIPDSIVTDQGSNFMSEVFKETCRLLKIKKIHCSSYHPQSNGSLERSHRTLVEYLRHFLNQDLTNWDEFLPYAAFTFNTTPHTSTKFSPFELLYGRKAKLPTSITKSPEVIYNYDDYTNELKARMQHSHEIARKNLLSSKEKSKEYYDKNIKQLKLKVGDKVLLRNEEKKAGKTKKLQSLYKGPYEVITIDSDVNCTIKINKKLIKVHMNRLKKFTE